MGKRSNKKVAQLLVVAPEPAGDEWESALRWDRVQLVDAPVASATMPGTHTAAFDNLFNVAFTVRQAAPLDLASARPAARDRVRAADVYCRAEEGLLATRAAVASAQRTLSAFESLEAAERQEAEQERGRFASEMDTLLGALDAAGEDADEGMDRAADLFLSEQQSLQARIYELLAHDHEVVGAFDERVATLAECARVTDAYYDEHGRHVTAMEAMQQETTASQLRSLEAMRAALQGAVSGLLAAALLPADGAAAGAADPPPGDRVGRSLLGGELARAAAAPSGASGEAAETLRRLVELEGQRLHMVRARNATLRRETEAARCLTRGAGFDNSASHSALVVPSTAAAAGRDLTNALAEERRRLDAVTAELSAAEEKLARAGEYHAAQLGGWCGPATLAAPPVSPVFQVPEVTAAARAAIVAAMVEADTALGGGSGDDAEGPFAHLLAVDSLEDRRAVQDFVARRLNRLFTSEHPTAPLTLLDAD